MCGACYQRWKLSRPIYCQKQKANSEKHYRTQHIRRKYGMTEKDYERMMSEQGGKCAICELRPVKKLHIDHNHSSGKIRGLLCGPCNHGIGLFGESPGRLAGAIRYLEKHV